MDVEAESDVQGEWFPNSGPKLKSVGFVRFAVDVAKQTTPIDAVFTFDAISGIKLCNMQLVAVPYACVCCVRAKHMITPAALVLR